MGAMELMARYDSDGSGQLDEDEMNEIKEWVQREKAAAEAAALKENTALTDMDYHEEKKGGGGIIDAKAVMALVQQVSVVGHLLQSVQCRHDCVCAQI
jgi:adenylate kinase